MKKINFVTLRLDVRSKYDGGVLDEDLRSISDITSISLEYFNRGEGEKWTADTPYTIVSEEYIEEE